MKDKPVPRSIDEMLDDAWNKDYDRNRFKQDLYQLIEWIIGDMEGRQTTDMSLQSWTHEDYKAFGKNELIIEQRNRLSQAMKGKK